MVEAVDPISVGRLIRYLLYRLRLLYTPSPPFFRILFCLFSFIIPMSRLDGITKYPLSSDTQVLMPNIITYKVCVFVCLLSYTVLQTFVLLFFAPGAGIALYARAEGGTTTVSCQLEGSDSPGSRAF